MQFITRLSRWALSGPRVWLSIIFVVFVILLFVYESLVSPTQDAKDFTLPNSKKEITAKKELTTRKPAVRENTNTDEDNDYDSLVTTDPLKSFETVTAPLRFNRLCD